MKAILLVTALLPIPTLAQSTLPDSHTAIVGKLCRGYYNQAEGGSGSLQRPESAFKTTTISPDGTFTLMAVKAAPGSSRGWDKADGNSYMNQSSTRFKPQSDGSLVFENVAALSSYRLTPVAGSAPGTEFAIVYSHGAGNAVGKAVCSTK